MAIKKSNRYVRVLVSAMLMSTTLVAGAKSLQKEITVAVYYYPGWAASATASGGGWAPILGYPERAPLLGHYDDGAVRVAEQHLKWMAEYGIEVVIYDWYWKPSVGVVHDEAIRAYGDVKQSAVQAALLWANHQAQDCTAAELKAIPRLWLDRYFTAGNYYTVDGSPVVVVFDPERLRRNEIALGWKPGTFISEANKQAVDRGLRGVYFVGASQSSDANSAAERAADGYSALSAYNYHLGMRPIMEKRRVSHSYGELARGYEWIWDTVLHRTSIPYWIPVTSGWDKRPWGGSEDPLHDESHSTASEFKSHLRDAKRMVDKYPKLTGRTVVICCWNEFGEGSYIEPTVKFQFQYLEAIRSVFGE